MPVIFVDKTTQMPGHGLLLSEVPDEGSLAEDEEVYVYQAKHAYKNGVHYHLIVKKQTLKEESECQKTQ